MSILNFIMYEPLEGSKPRRLIKRTHNRNPTFQSLLVNELLQYNPQLESKRHNAASPIITKKEIYVEKSSNKRTQSATKIQFDSLCRAEKQFKDKKLRNPLYFSDKSVKQADESLKIGISRVSTIHRPTDSTLSFKSSYQIKMKQNHGYDIIRNF